VSPVGTGRDEMFDALCRGVSGAREITGFDTSKLDRHVGCEVSGFVAEDHLRRVELDRAGRCGHFALAAARIALADAGLAGGFADPERVSVVLGTTMGEANLLGDLEELWFHRGAGAVPAEHIARYGTGNLPAQVARAVGARGVVQALPAACAAGNYALGQAAREIRRGRADIVVTGASEVIERLQYAGFARLGAMAPERVRPFDVDRSGILVGEGAGILVLESEASLVRRGGRPLAEVGALGLACDAHHITRPHPEGEGSRRALVAAIERSGLGPEDVDHVNAHGTGTPSNDVIEARVLGSIFGDRRPPVTSLKSMLGHCMGAASALEAIACVLTIESRTLDVLDVVLNNALAFGGYDAALLLARPGKLGEFWQ
jgi:3-oxoacyl-[acyl-carrier-protein] synthase II